MAYFEMVCFEMTYFEIAYFEMVYFKMAYFGMAYFEMAYFLNVSKNKTRLLPWLPQAAFSLSFGISRQPYNQPCREAAGSANADLREPPCRRGFFLSTIFYYRGTLYRMKGNGFLILLKKGDFIFFPTFFKGLKT